MNTPLNEELGKQDMAKESYGTIYKGDREQLDLCKAEKLHNSGGHSGTHLFIAFGRLCLFE